MRVVIVGAGHDGSYLAERLVAEGQEVVAPDGTSEQDIAFNGRLERFGLPQLLEFLKTNNSSGRLHIVTQESGVVFMLHRGDLIAIYSDGITECMHDSGERFGEERLHKENQ